MKTLVRNNIVEKLAILAEFHDEKQFTFCLDDFVELDDVGVPYLFQNLDLPADSLDVLFVFDSRLFKDLNGNLNEFEISMESQKQGTRILKFKFASLPFHVLIDELQV
jgi:hypothetical protein